VAGNADETELGVEVYRGRWWPSQTRGDEAVPEGTGCRRRMRRRRVTTRPSTEVMDTWHFRGHRPRRTRGRRRRIQKERLIKKRLIREDRVAQRLQLLNRIRLPCRAENPTQDLSQTLKLTVWSERLTCLASFLGSQEQSEVSTPLVPFSSFSTQH
jgi:hypothetical protein